MPLYKHLIHTQYYLPLVSLVSVNILQSDTLFRGPAGWLCGIAFWWRNGYERLESGVPHQHVHYMDAERLCQYHTDNSVMARILRLTSVLFNPPEHVLNEIVKDSVNHQNDAIIIIDDETYGTKCLNILWYGPSLTVYVRMGLPTFNNFEQTTRRCLQTMLMAKENYYFQDN